MMLRSHSVWVVPVAATLLGFGPGAARATAQSINLQFGPTTAVSTTTLRPIQSAPNTFEATDRATILDPEAALGITEFINRNFVQILPTGEIPFSPDPETFGLQGFSRGTATFLGQGSDRLFATFSGSASFATNTSSGTIDIFGGEGRFSGATGTLTFVEEVTEVTNVSPSLVISGRATISGTIRTSQPVPEPGTIAATLGVLGVVGINSLLRRRNDKVAI